MGWAGRGTSIGNDTLFSQEIFSNEEGLEDARSPAFKCGSIQKSLKGLTVQINVNFDQL